MHLSDSEHSGSLVNFGLKRVLAGQTLGREIDAETMPESSAAIASRFRTIARLTSNDAALDDAVKFAGGSLPFVLIEGATGVGKSQLLKATAEACRASSASSAYLLSAEQFVNSSKRIHADEPLILDDCHEVLNRPHQRLRLRIALDRRMRSGGRTMISCTQNARRAKLYERLPRPGHWKVATVQNPTKRDRFLLIEHLCELEEVELSATLKTIIAQNLNGNGRVLLGAVRRLKLIKPVWTTEADALKACGALTCFFADNSAWDLRHRIHREAVAIAAGEPALNELSLSCHGMLQLAHLCETSVANYLERSQAEVYRASRDYARFRKDDPELADSVNNELIHRVLLRLRSQPSTIAD